MAHNISVKLEAIKLRKAGYSIKEIANKLNIAISSSSIWLRNVQITPTGQDRMIKHKEQNRYKMQQEWIAKRNNTSRVYQKSAKELIEHTNISPNVTKFICSTLFWAEGSKHTNHVAFTNSDPMMIKTFITLLRRSYNLDESKFRITVHLHEYHDKTQIMQFWSEITKVPLKQFIKPYLKPHTAIRKHDNYKGCITIRYYDVQIARELTAIYNALGDKYRDVVQR